MRIDIDRNLVTLSPESTEEKSKLETLWRLLVDCVGTGRRLAPVGEYSPLKGDGGAAFQIEGMPSDQSQYKGVRVDRDCTAYCQTCNRIVKLRKGDAIPLCCGKVMEIVD